MSPRSNRRDAQVVAQQALIEEKIVKAPFAGRLGIRQVDLGQYLAAGTTVVTLQALDPMLIDFYVPQQALEHLKIGQAATATVDTYPGETFKGTVESINSKVDTASRNVQVRASFQQCRSAAGARHVRERRGRLRRVDHADHRARRPAITYNPYGDTVYLVQHGKGSDGKPKDTVEQRFVKLGATRGDQVAILERRQGGRCGRVRRPDQAAQRLDGHRQQYRAADGRHPIRRRRTNSRRSPP